VREIDNLRRILQDRDNQMKVTEDELIRKYDALNQVIRVKDKEMRAGDLDV